jgi:chromosome segregation protein
LSLSESAGRGLHFVTRAGELVAADGTLYVGPRHASTGLISRRSELRGLRLSLAELAQQIEKHQAECAAWDQRIADADQRAQANAAQYRQSNEQLQAERLRAGNAEERLHQLQRQQSMVETELAATAAEHSRAACALGEVRLQSTSLATALEELESSLAEGARRTSELEQLRQRSSREAGATKIEMVKSEQRLSHLRAQKSQLERDQLERGKALADSRSQLEVSLARLRDSQRAILQSESELAELYLSKQHITAEAAGHVGRRDLWREEKAQHTAEATRARAKIRKLEGRLHARQLAASEVRHERGTLADRLREDYGIELAELEHQASPEEIQQRDEVEREIADLRSKLNSIGGVNLDALTELDELEARYNTLSGQFQDLTSAKSSLESIIGKINADSRRLFAETLEVVREHFQALFRKLFGGGQADIVLDEGVDILDSGIEIVARPPGKEPRNISLLSGGEKTLTCVALLLAIFRSRPSPFCVLDEVDAALDEANIERFIGVLQEFLAWTQFIVVTHSKKTMTCASTLYGVTMEESGVSKRVSVRFEDVSDDGQIRRTQPAGLDEDETQAA